MDPVIRNIEKIMLEKGLKKKAVAQKAGLTPQQFSDMLNGRRVIKHSDIAFICDALEVTPNDIYSIIKSA